MNRLSILTISLAFITLSLNAQTPAIALYPDAIPYSLKTPSNLYLTNQVTETVKAFFLQPGHPQPDKIMKVDEGYYHGYRLCYAGTGQHSPESWIQVVTINTTECIKWREKHNLESLWLPFQGIKELTGKFNHSEDEYSDVYNQYKHLACRLYRLTEDKYGADVNELSLILEKYSEKIDAETNQMLASGEEGLLMRPVNANENEWSQWIQCFEEIDVVGYITLIEYSGIPVP
jgi:hypothetical protein